MIFGPRKLIFTRAPAFPIRLNDSFRTRRTFFKWFITEKNISEMFRFVSFEPGIKNARDAQRSTPHLHLNKQCIVYFDVTKIFRKFAKLCNHFYSFTISLRELKLFKVELKHLLQRIWSLVWTGGNHFQIQAFVCKSTDFIHRILKNKCVEL